MIYRIYFLILFLLSSINLFSQNENKKWFFGHGAAIDFQTSPPSLIPNSSMSVTAGASSIADSNGNLLFYSNGNTVWDQTNSVMANGTGLFTSIYANTSSLIVKEPGSANTYYIFTLDGSQFNSAGFHYSVIDMTLAAGMGSVTVKNSPIYTGYCAQKLTGTRHSNGADFWIVIHEMLSNNFRSYLVTSAGVSTVPVISSVGTTHAQWEIVGRMKISPTGNKIGLRYSGNGSQHELYDFDNSTGIVSNPLILPNSAGGWGVEFSPDGSKFYGSIYLNSQYYLSQWDLSTGTNSAIVASQYTVPSGNLGEMQLAPNGKIYIARFQQNDLGVINSPNCLGSGCNFVDLGFSIAPKYTWWSIPNLITSTANINTSNIMIGGNTNICLGGSTTLTVNGAISYTWNTGSTSSVIAVSPTLTTQYSVATTPSATCPNSGSIVAVTINVWPSPSVQVTGDVPICIGESATLSASGANTYLWNSGANTSSIIVSPVGNATYQVIGSSTNNCQDTVSVNLLVNPLPNIRLSASVDTVCAGETTTLIASGGVVYNWSNGFTGLEMPVIPFITTTYTVKGIDANGCSKNSSVTIFVDACTSLLEIEKDVYPVIYPNPNSGIFVIQVNNLRPDTKVEIYNSMGQIVYWSSLVKIDTEIVLKDFESGIYFLRILEGHHQIFYKKVLKH